MARKPTPDGRRVHENIRLSEPEAALIDAVRGTTARGPWMRQAALEVARRTTDSGILERLGIGIMVDDRQPPGIVSVVGPGEEVTEVRSFTVAPEAEPGARPCRHKGLKLSKGVCPDCDQWVVKS
jgi:hypothetical protein